MKIGDLKIDKRFLFISLIIISICFIIIGIKSMQKQDVYASAIEDVSFKDEKENQEIYQETEIRNVEKEYEKQEIEIEYITKYEEDETLPNGMIQIKQEGRIGIQEIVIEKIYEDGELILEEVISDKIVKGAVNKVVVTGTAKYKSNYKVRVEDKLYVTSYTLALRRTPDINSDKVYTLSENYEVEVLEIEKEWYKIKYGAYEGYVPINCLTYFKPNSKNQGSGDEIELSRAQLMSKFSFGMKLNEPSGLTLGQFKKVLSGIEQDTNRVFEQNAEYFYYAEKQYNVNGIFLAALGIHESGFGTSKISLDKRNLFGYGASDSNPYGNAQKFAGYSEGIDLVARVLAKNYLNPTGTSIYDGEVATGAYYYSSTLSGVNTKYATDKNWANAIYQWMQFLYERI